MYVNNAGEQATAEQVHALAVRAGLKAAREAKPTPMVVTQRVNPFDDASEVVKQWSVSEGVCGFAWVVISGNTAFGRWVRKHHWGDDTSRMLHEQEGGRWSKGYPSGYSWWVWAGGQSYDRKRAYAHAFASTLNDFGIEATVGSRMD